MSFLSEIDIDQLPVWAEAQARGITHLDYTQPLMVCSYLIAEDIHDNFVNECDPDKVPTKPLAHPRNKTRGKGQRGRSPSGTTHQLWDTGRLAASYGVGGVGNINQVSQFQLIFGSNLMTPDGQHCLAAIHHYGATIPERTRRPGEGKPMYRFEVEGDTVFSWHIKETEIPARPRAGIGEELANKLADVVTEFVAGKMFQTA